MSKNKSIFSKIVDREIPATILYEDDVVIAFLDAFPYSEGHFLVVPKDEKENMLESDEKTFLHAMKVARELAQKLVVDKGIESFKLLVNTGANAGQTVFHTHIHIIPFKEKMKSNSEVI
ncbi:histidine triad protein HinT [Mycoplasmopsis columboralis]|uniref:Histidine triad nucleotide-binding (HIT-like) protein n=1 Tax=Mycoplasmopsis columboralis TaxID=171282 RepID=A0A449B6W7_9BACT|nr:HIT family protein [Mycoplasmopsis columboralis]VEU76344.1 histidine triad nucleotide-binding (HIT-like) protein [Mycoplasmopsis columboralis]